MSKRTNTNSFLKSAINNSEVREVLHYAYKETDNGPIATADGYRLHIDFQSDDYEPGVLYPMGKKAYKGFEGRFPDFMAVVPRNTEHIISVHPEPLLWAVQSAGVFASDNADSITLHIAYDMTTSKGNIDVIGKSAERGDISTIVSCAGNIQCNFVYSLNWKFLRDALKHMKHMDTVTLRFNGQVNAMTISDYDKQDRMVVIMPMAADSPSKNIPGCIDLLAVTGADDSYYKKHVKPSAKVKRGAMNPLYSRRVKAIKDNDKILNKSMAKRPGYIKDETYKYADKWQEKSNGDDCYLIPVESYHVNGGKSSANWHGFNNYDHAMTEIDGKLTGVSPIPYNLTDEYKESKKRQLCDDLNMETQYISLIAGKTYDIFEQIGSKNDYELLSHYIRFTETVELTADVRSIKTISTLGNKAIIGIKYDEIKHIIKCNVIPEPCQMYGYIYIGVFVENLVSETDKQETGLFNEWLNPLYYVESDTLSSITSKLAAIEKMVYRSQSDSLHENQWRKVNDAYASLQFSLYELTRIKPYTGPNPKPITDNDLTDRQKMILHELAMQQHIGHQAIGVDTTLSSFTPMYIWDGKGAIYDWELIALADGTKYLDHSSVSRGKRFVFTLALYHWRDYEPPAQQTDDTPQPEPFNAETAKNDIDLIIDPLLGGEQLNESAYCAFIRNHPLPGEHVERIREHLQDIVDYIGNGDDDHAMIHWQHIHEFCDTWQNVQHIYQPVPATDTNAVTCEQTTQEPQPMEPVKSVASDITDESRAIVKYIEPLTLPDDTPEPSQEITIIEGDTLIDRWHNWQKMPMGPDLDKPWRERQAERWQRLGISENPYEIMAEINNLIKVWNTANSSNPKPLPYPLKSARKVRWLSSYMVNKSNRKYFWTREVRATNGLMSNLCDAFMWSLFGDDIPGLQAVLQDTTDYSKNPDAEPCQPDTLPAENTDHATITAEYSQKDPNKPGWWWFSGDTKPVKDTFKANGARWARRRKQWYYIGDTLPEQLKALIHGETPPTPPTGNDDNKQGAQSPRKRAKMPKLTKSKDGRLDVADAAKLIRWELDNTYPDTKFKVITERYSMGNSINVSWFEGPLQKTVEQIVNQYQSGRFDGMTDLSYDVSIDVHGFTSGGAKHTFCSRHYTSETAESWAQWALEKHALTDVKGESIDPDTVTYTITPHREETKKLSASSAGIRFESPQGEPRFGNEWLSHYVQQKIHEFGTIDDMHRIEAEKEAEFQAYYQRSERDRLIRAELDRVYNDTVHIRTHGDYSEVFYSGDITETELKTIIQRVADDSDITYTYQEPEPIEEPEPLPVVETISHDITTGKQLHDEIETLLATEFGHTDFKTEHTARYDGNNQLINGLTVYWSGSPSEADVSTSLNPLTVQQTDSTRVLHEITLHHTDYEGQTVAQKAETDAKAGKVINIMDLINHNPIDPDDPTPPSTPPPADDDTEDTPPVNPSQTPPPQPDAENVAELFTNEDFYPTNYNVIHQMMEPFGRTWGSLDGRIILEPSAGKGDICDYIRKVYNVDASDIHVIEPDLELQMILGEKGYTLIDSDFLKYTDFYPFDLIVMNPPFRNGDAHLLKAWDILQPGGDIVCLLNSETIRNPHTKQRELLVHLIEQHGRFEEIGSMFAHSARPTRVEVTIVWLHKPKADTPADDFDPQGFDFDTEQQEEAFVANPLAHRDIITSLVDQYNEVCRLHLERAKIQAQIEFYIQQVRKADDEATQKTNLMATLNDIKKKFWDYVFNKTRIGKSLTTTYRETFETFYARTQKLAFTVNNVVMVLEMFVMTKDENMVKSAVSVFDRATAYHKENTIHPEGWVTNKSWKVADKIIMPRIVSRDKFGWSFGYNRQNHSFLDDFDRVLCWLDGKEFDDILSTTKAIQQRIYQLRDDSPPEVYHEPIESEYFTIKIHAKGTAHLSIKDKQLEDMFNQTATQGKEELGPGY